MHLLRRPVALQLAGPMVTPDKLAAIGWRSGQHTEAMGPTRHGKSQAAADLLAARAARASRRDRRRFWPHGSRPPRLRPRPRIRINHHAVDHALLVAAVGAHRCRPFPLAAGLFASAPTPGAARPTTPEPPRP